VAIVGAFALMTLVAIAVYVAMLELFGVHDAREVLRIVRQRSSRSTQDPVL
jgi:hypothetical protein